MNTLTTVITYGISVGLVLAQVCIMVTIVFYVVTLFDKQARIDFTKTKKAAFFRDHSFLLAFIVALGALLSSLYYSEIAHFPPCELCWIQRAFWYPQVLILLVPAFIKGYKDHKALYYIILALSVIGACIAGYHYYGQIFNASVLPCGITPAQSLCAQIPFQIFGYITIPMMSFTGFLLQAAIMVWYKLSLGPSHV